MHAFTTLSTLAISAILSHAAALPATSPANPLLLRRNGCYSGGLAFDELHGDETDTQEVVNDINTTCQLADGVVLAPGASWTHCSEWAFSRYNDCWEECEDGCAAMASSGARGAEGAAATCSAGCDPNCGGRETGTNHIYWEIKNEGSADATITWGACNAALNTELGGCSTGSEQSHDGFWYRIDPNDGSCPA